ncbi:ATP-binding protein [bacterium]|nr:ATP-binding protein [bacterium]
MSELSKKRLSARDRGSGIAHDANNMLSATIGHLQLLEKILTSPDPAVQKHLDAALFGCHHIAQLLAEWRSHSKVRKSAQEEEWKYFPLEKTLGRLTNMISTLIPERITFHSSIEVAGKVHGHEYKIEQTVLNFILNAVQAIPEQGEIELRAFSLSDAKGRNSVVISVRDTGVGIPAEKISKIFRPKYSSKKQRGGSGLGLPMCQEIIREHRGKISVDSKPDAGATFAIELPFFPEQQELAESSDEGMSSEQERKPQVMVVDDTPSLLSVMEGFLEEYGMEPRAFSDSREALHWSTQHGNELDLIVLDLNLPEVSGKESFYRYKEMIPDVPILVYSGERSEDAEELLREGAAQFLEKPIDFEETMLWIRDTIEKKHSQSE